MMAYVIKPGRETIEVKNLGWLIRHARQVNLLLWNTGSQYKKNTFSAYLEDGTIFESSYNCLDICRDWIKRSRTWKGITFSVDGVDEII